MNTFSPRACLVPPSLDIIKWIFPRLNLSVDCHAVTWTCSALVTAKLACSDSLCIIWPCHLIHAYIASSKNLFATDSFSFLSLQMLLPYAESQYSHGKLSDIPHLRKSSLSLYNEWVTYYRVTVSSLGKNEASPSSSKAFIASGLHCYQAGTH